MPRAAVVLGSGLGHLADGVDGPVSARFDELPGLSASSVEGHEGRFVHGTLDGVELLLQAGRCHAYEGHPMEAVVAPTRLLAAVGVEVVVYTNAAGGIRADLAPGSIVLIEDHLNMMFRSPLAGPVVGAEERFPDMSAPYDPALQELARQVAAEQGVALSRGTYAAVLGPSYETAAEVRMLARLGADLVGMSTVPEVVAARALGLRCAAFSMVTNRATGLGGGEITHDEVLEIGRRAGRALGSVIVGLVRALAAGAQSGDTK